jgi:hypothetical protein
VNPKVQERSDGTTPRETRRSPIWRGGHENNITSKINIICSLYSRINYLNKHLMLYTLQRSIIFNKEEQYIVIEAEPDWNYEMDEEDKVEFNPENNHHNCVNDLEPRMISLISSTESVDGEAIGPTPVLSTNPKMMMRRKTTMKQPGP